MRSVLFDPDFVIVETMDGQGKGENLIFICSLKIKLVLKRSRMCIRWHKARCWDVGIH